MLVRLLVKMLCILVLCPALLVAVQTLTIDSQLGTSIEGKKYKYISKNQVRFNLIMPTPLTATFVQSDMSYSLMVNYIKVDSSGQDYQTEAEINFKTLRNNYKLY